MTNFTNASARRLAREIQVSTESRRKEILQALDTDFRCMVLKELSQLEDWASVSAWEPAPLTPGKVPNCS